MEIIGQIKIGLSDESLINVLKDEENNVYIANDVAAFLQASSTRKYLQKIQKIVSKTAFMVNEAPTMYAHTSENKETLQQITNLIGKVDDSNLTSLVKLCEGADNSDVLKFKNTLKILEYKELDTAGSNLSYGLGFPGKGLALVVVEDDLQIKIERKVYIQIVDSYMEGYSVEHKEITLEIFNIIKLNLVNHLFIKQ